MKRRLLGTLLFVALALSFIPTPAHAAPLYITIKGTVTKDGRPVPGILVGISCRSESQYQYIGNAATDANGQYVGYAATFDCPAGAAVSVTAGPDEDGKMVTVTKSRLYPDTIVDVQMGKSYYVPEYDWLGGTLAVVAGVGVIAIARRRAAA